MDFLIISILIALSALFVMAELALVSASRARLEPRAAKGSGGAAAAIVLMDAPTRFLSTVQIGITLIGIFLGAFGEAAVADDLETFLKAQGMGDPAAHYVSLGLTVVIITVPILIVGELVPKRLAQLNPEGISTVLAPPMLLLSRVCAPVVWLLSGATDLILRMLPFRPVDESKLAEEEVKALLASGAKAGVFHRSEQQMVERVFNLSDRSVKSLMVPRTDIDWLPHDSTSERVRVVVATSSHSHFPVCRGGLDDLIGVVHVKDLVKSGLISEDIDLEALARDPMFVPESTPALKLLEQFKETGTHLAFVLDEYGVLEGLVTLNDLVGAIIGDVTRADDREEPMVIRRKDGSFLIDGRLPVDELKSVLAVERLPRDEEAGYETLGGFVMTHLGRIPASGDVFVWGRHRFEVVDMDRARVDKVMVTFVSSPAVKPGQATGRKPSPPPAPRPPKPGQPPRQGPGPAR
jgi:putative hemolysin